MNNLNIRRTIGFLVTVIVTGRLCYQLAWEPELRDRLLDSPWQSVGLLTLFILALIALVWAMLDPNSWRTFMAFVLGIGVAIWGRQLLEGISWGQIGILAGIFTGLVILWVVTTWNDLFGT